jgi:hypothetical protein
MEDSCAAMEFKSEIQRMQGSMPARRLIPQLSKNPLKQGIAQ